MAIPFASLLPAQRHSVLNKTRDRAFRNVAKRPSAWMRSKFRRRNLNSIKQEAMTEMASSAKPFEVVRVDLGLSPFGFCFHFPCRRTFLSNLHRIRAVQQKPHEKTYSRRNRIDRYERNRCSSLPRSVRVRIASDERTSFRTVSSLKSEDSDLKVESVVLPDGEAFKSVDVVNQVWTRALECNLSR